MEDLVERDKIINRLKRIEGQVRGIQKMLTQERDCEEILMQVSALNAAMTRVTRVMIACYMGERIKEEFDDHGDSYLAVKKALDFFINTNP